MKRKFCSLAVLILLYGYLQAQTSNQAQPYTYDFYQKFNREVYNKDTRFHSSLKPFFTDDNQLYQLAGSLRDFGAHDTRRNVWMRKLLDEHMLDVQKETHTAFIDFYPDFVFGQDMEAKKTTLLTSYGFQAGGTVGEKFSFYLNLYGGSSTLPDYLLKYIDSNQVVPGQGIDRTFGKNDTKNWGSVMSHVSYSPSRYVNIMVGQGKTFIGDGYRSMILSDFSSSYPFLRVTANLGRVQYMAMWAAMKDPGGKQLSYDSGYRKKGAVFHYLDWNITKRFSLGFFDAVVWSQYDDNGIHRSFDWSYANPLIFIRQAEEMNGSPDNVLTGFNAKYEITKSITLYGQFLMDEFKPAEFFSKSGYWANKVALQGGFKAHDLFTLKGLNFRAEFNKARPFTYSERTRSINYSNYNEALAHPYGGNFIEGLGILSYSRKRLQLHAQVNYAKYGTDADSVSYGKDIFKSYHKRVGNYGNVMFQGLLRTFNYMEGRASFIINPKTNLRIEAGAILRSEQGSLSPDKTNWVTIGLRSSFNSFYKDF